MSDEKADAGFIAEIVCNELDQASGLFSSKLSCVPWGTIYDAEDVSSRMMCAVVHFAKINVPEAGDKPEVLRNWLHLIVDRYLDKLEAPEVFDA